MNLKNHHKNKHLLLRSYIDLWLSSVKVTRQVVAVEIVEKFFELGLDQSVQVEDIFFMRTGDTFADAQANQQKIFRWLGVLNDGQHRNLEKIFFIEPAIVAAMPEDIRLHYDTDVKQGSGLYSSLKFKTNALNQVDRKDIVVRLTKEHAEAQISLIKLPTDPSAAELSSVRRELLESIAIGQAALEHVDELLKKHELA